MQTAILIAAILAVKYLDYRQTRWILGPGKAQGFRELNPLITHEGRILPVMGSMTALAVAIGLFWQPALAIYLIVSVVIVYRNHRIGVQLWDGQ